MKRFKYLVIVLAALITASCSSDKSDLTVKPVSKKINGPLGEYFEVVDREYTMKSKEDTYDLSIDIKRIAEGGPEKFSYSNNFTVEFLDEDGNTITKTTTNAPMDVINLNTDETCSISFLITGEEVEDIQGAKKIRITSTWDVDDNAESENDSESEDYDFSSDDDTYDDDLSESSSSTDWDELLDDYEKYTDSYIRLYKKAMNGDMSALSEYADMLDKAENVYEKMEDAGNMSTAQINRMNKIHQKMLKAM